MSNKKVTISPVLQEIAELRAKKAQDYNGGSVKLDDYFPFGQVSYTQMIHVKSLRLISLTEQDGNANFEGIEDTLKDIINYATFNLEAIKNGQL